MQHFRVIDPEDRQFIRQVGAEHAIEKPLGRSDRPLLTTGLNFHRHCSVVGQHLKTRKGRERLDAAAILNRNIPSRFDHLFTPWRISIDLAHLGGDNAPFYPHPNQAEFDQQEKGH